MIRVGNRTGHVDDNGQMFFAGTQQTQQWNIEPPYQDQHETVATRDMNKEGSTKPHLDGIRQLAGTKGDGLRSNEILRLAGRKRDGCLRNEGLRLAGRKRDGCLLGGTRRDCLLIQKGYLLGRGIFSPQEKRRRITTRGSRGARRCISQGQLSIVR